jgi:ANTAR domain
VWLSITSLARDEGATVAVRHAVIACGDALGAEAALLLAPDHRPYEPVFATGARSDELTDLQTTLGEGPAVEAGNGHGPVLGADLRTAESQARWPEFAPVALARGVAAVFAVPVGSGAARLGVLCLYRERAQELTRDQLDCVLLYADAATILALDDRGGLAPGSAELIGVSFSERRAEVHQATGMISVQLGISVTDALVTLRAHAYAEGRPVAQIAADVVGRRFSFSGPRDGYPAKAAGPGPPGPPDQNHDHNRADNKEEMEGE